jgi:hypothetical protein
MQRRVRAESTAARPRSVLTIEIHVSNNAQWLVGLTNGLDKKGLGVQLQGGLTYAVLFARWVTHTSSCKECPKKKAGVKP